MWGWVAWLSWVWVALAWMLFAMRGDEMLNLAMGSTFVGIVLLAGWGLSK